jgi:hypothetical protein
VGRQFIVVSAVALLAVSASQATFGQGSGPRSHARPNRQFNGPRAPLYQLSPEERQAFRRNAERWLQMNPEQQKMLREREQVRRQRLKAEAEAAMRQLGLRLDPNAQDQFEARYMQERRKIERDLRQEFETKRQEQNERLKSEFQSRQGGAPSTASPATSAKPATTSPGGSRNPHH